MADYGVDLRDPYGACRGLSANLSCVSAASAYRRMRTVWGGGSRNRMDAAHTVLLNEPKSRGPT